MTVRRTPRTDALEALPVRDAVPALRRALDDRGAAVLCAPPGTGKTTLVPLALAGAADGGPARRVLVAEPRRIAARAAARRMAWLLGEDATGGRVGFTVRGERRVSRETVVEVVTTGVLLQRLQRDPELAGVDAVVLDECHERHLDADTAAAFLLDVRATLRPDLWLIAASATTDAEGWARLLGADGEPAPVVSAEGVSHPVEVVWAPPARPIRPPHGMRVDLALLDHVAGVVRRALREREGDVLCFLPGVGEIARVAGLLGGADAEVLQVHGRAPAAAQDAVLAGAGPTGRRRRVVLATSVAESSLTVPGVRIVVDCGLAREPRMDHARGLSALTTVRASRAAARQRAGRAGREAPGTVYRCWPEAEDARLPRFPSPEISVADLTAFALQAACWGDPDASGLALLDPPPGGALTAAREVLTAIGAVDGAGRATDRGTRMARLGLHPRLARALLDGAPEVGARRAAEAVALLSEEPPREYGDDLAAAWRTARRGTDAYAARWRQEARRLESALRSAGRPAGGTAEAGAGAGARTEAQAGAEAAGGAAPAHTGVPSAGTRKDAVPGADARGANGHQRAQAPHATTADTPIQGTATPHPGTGGATSPAPPTPSAPGAGGHTAAAAAEPGPANTASEATTAHTDHPKSPAHAAPSSAAPDAGAPGVAMPEAAPQAPAAPGPGGHPAAAAEALSRQRTAERDRAYAAAPGAVGDSSARRSASAPATPGAAASSAARRAAGAGAPRGTAPDSDDHPATAPAAAAQGPARASAADHATTPGTLTAGAVGDDAVVGLVAALAFPERVGRRRGERAYLMASGTGAELGEGSRLRDAPWLAVAVADRPVSAASARVRLAAVVDEETARIAASALYERREEVGWSGGDVVARRVERLGAVELAARPLAAPDPRLVHAALRDGLRGEGLGLLRWSAEAVALRQRLAFLHRELGAPWPDVSDPALLAELDAWLGPELDRARRRADLGRVDAGQALARLLPWATGDAVRFDELAPERVRVPSGSRVRVDYGQEQPVLAVKLQELFGWQETPRIAGGRVPLLVHLLSPAGRPAAVTADLASFWREGYRSVRAELRGRYPKHPWPEDPATAEPTRRTNSRR
ncbi:ATP-dependent helicase C-terminal domain-containing protein [Streptomyces sp. NPDC020845]|uniref:ATP-dependent helicase C-terminal domain-containing protein n=1 Tax=Streptomyces sp. NPDC020845 TaxID=3365096 RepID=UPI003789C8B1